jgi:prepilin-type processing-associated H-X9-DG protein
MSSLANAVGRSSPLAIMLCPSDTYNQVPFAGKGNGAPSETNSMGGTFGDAVDRPWARGNYAANGALGFMSASHDVWGCAGPATTAAPGWGSRWLRGVMGANTAVRLKEIRDGTSKTLMIGEIRAGIVSFDCRGVWAMSGGPSALWAHGYHGDCNGPNQIDPGFHEDDSWACPYVQATVGGQQKLSTVYKIGCSADDWPNWQETCRSTHVGGANICLADGSVRFVSDFIDKGTDGTNQPKNLGVWDKLNLSMDGETIESNQF